MRIDIHSHFYTREYVETIRRFDRARGSKITGVNFSVWTSADERIARMDRFGIDMEVLSLSGPNVYFEDRSLSLELAQMTNDFAAELMRTYPQRFVGMASLPMLDVGDSLAELHRAVETLGLKGVVLGTNMNGKYPDGEELEPLYAEIERLGLSVFVHPMPPGNGQEPDRYKLTAILLLPFDTTVCVTRMIFEGIFERHPDIPVILPHLGGTLPFLATRIDLGFRNYRECREKASRPPSEYLKEFYYDTAVSFGSPALSCVRELIGEGHLMFGTDYPFQRDPSDTISAVGASGRDALARDAIFAGNAQKLFGIGARGSQ